MASTNTNTTPAQRRFASNPSKPCTFFLTSSCRYGDTCRFAHTAEAPPSEEIQPDEKSGIDCRYWVNGEHCRFGDTCRYEHREGMFGSGVTPPQQRPADNTKQLKKPVATSFGWRKNRTGSADDPDWRRRPDMISEVISKNFQEEKPIAPDARVCRYWEQSGRCRFGDKCRFLHPMAAPQKKPHIIKHHEDKEVRERRTHKPTFSSTSWEEIMDEEAENGGLFAAEDVLGLLKQGNAAG